jgi:hypothetical protein
MSAVIKSIKRLVAITACGLLATWTACGTNDSQVDRGQAVEDAGDVGTDAFPADTTTPIDVSIAEIKDSRGDSHPDIDTSDPSFCTRSSDCYVFPSDCCSGNCATDLVPISGIELRVYFRSCTERGCTPCVADPRWIPRCTGNRCGIIDLDTSSDSACTVDADCELRWGTRCCHPCAPVPDTALVSTARTAIFCASGDVCDPCRHPDFPAGATAVCRDGRCKVQR